MKTSPQMLLTAIPALGALGLMAMAPARAADFYAGKTIEIVVGSAAGGGYDIYARAVAKYWGNYIPGHPTFIVRNMPGAGSARSLAYISAAAPKDGTVIGAPMPGAILGPLLDDKPQVGFDPTKVIYLGTADSGVRVCVTSEKSRIKTFDDALANKTIMGATGGHGSSSDYAYLHKHTSGAKFDVVTGYVGMADTSLAMEQGELDGTCGWDWSSLKSMKPDWVKNKRMNILVQVGLDTDPELNRLGVPEVWKYVPAEEDRKVVELVASQQVFMRFFIAPPGTPPEQVNTLRQSFSAAVKDKRFLEEAERLHIAIEPLPGEKVQDLVQKIYATPKSIVERTKRAINP